MKIDLFKLNNYNKIDFDEDFLFSKEIYEKTDVRSIVNTHVKGMIEINYEDELVADLVVSGTFILPCAVTLEDVSYKFETKIEENLGKFENFYNKNKNSLDILPILWENVVLEVPIRVVKDNIDINDVVVSGEGWELVSND